METHASHFTSPVLFLCVAFFSLFPFYSLVQSGRESEEGCEKEIRQGQDQRRRSQRMVFQGLVADLLSAPFVGSSLKTCVYYSFIVMI